jgi:hypothetical protein
LTLADGAKTSMSRANITAEHEGSGAIRPAFKNVWATCLLANSVQVQAFDQLQQIVLVRRITQPNL